MSNKLVAELALDAFDNVMSFQAARLEKKLDECTNFDDKMLVIFQLVSENATGDNQYKKVFNAMLCLIADDFTQVIRYAVR